MKFSFVLLLVFILSFSWQKTNMLFAQSTNEEIEIELPGEEPGTETAEDEIDIELDQPPVEVPQEKPEPLNLQKEITRFQYELYGRAFYYLMASQVRDEDSLEKDNFYISDAQMDFILGLKIINRKNLFIRTEFAFYTGEALPWRTSGLNFNNLFFYFNNIHAKYYQSDFDFILFYRDYILNFDDPLRMLDEEDSNFYRPIILFQQQPDHRAFFGREHYGLYLDYHKQFNNRLCICAPVSWDKLDNKLLVINRFSKTLSLLDLAASFIYIDQEFDIPDLEDTTWGEYHNITYEFYPDTLYDPEENDCKIKATGEVGVNLARKFRLFAEAGIDRKSGGVYLETVQQSTSDGNIPFFMTVSSPYYNYFLTGFGAQVDLQNIIIEGSYASTSGELNSFYYDEQVLTRKTEPGISDIKVKGLISFKFIHSAAEYTIRKVNDDQVTEEFDYYNFNHNVYLNGVESLNSIRSHNKIDLGMLALYPDAEYRVYKVNYLDPADRYRYEGSINTMEINGGLEVYLTRNLETFFNTRYKTYNLDLTGVYQNEAYQDQRNKKYLSFFLGWTYHYKKGISIGIMYGLDPRLEYEYGYGFEYILNDYIDQHSGNDFHGFDSVFEAEKYIAENHFIVVAGSIEF